MPFKHEKEWRDFATLPKIGKLEAARRQIEFAISAHFSDQDPFAIHTVISAAFGILRPLADKRGSVRLHRAMLDRIRPGKEAEYWGYFNRASNFLKHSDRDPGVMLEDVHAEINDSAIFFAIAYYADLNDGATSRTMDMFWSWYLCLHPNVMSEEMRSRFREQQLQELSQLSEMRRAAQLEAGRMLIAIKSDNDTGRT